MEKKFKNEILQEILSGNINENKILGMSEAKFSHKLLHDILNNNVQVSKRNL